MKRKSKSWPLRTTFPFLRGAAACALLVLAGCSVMTSAPVFEAGKSFLGCSSRLGSYALPRRVLEVKISAAGDDFFLETLAASKPIPDNAHNYCLEHDNNHLADDSIRMYKDKIEIKNGSTAVSTEQRTPFLQLIASKAVDHTAGVIRNIIRAIFIGLSNNPSFGRAKFGTDAKNLRIVADHQVDPFNFYEMAELNQSIRRYGFCVVLAGYTFNERTLDATSYCDAPRSEAPRHVPPSFAAIKAMRWHVPKPTSGIFYRPRAPYSVEVYIKHRPDDIGAWQLALMKTEFMENIMPIVSVGIEREAFAERRTGLIFDDGELVNVCISKGNGIEGPTNIVLDVVYGVINLPSATIQAVIDDTNTRQKLIEKRNELYTAQQKYIAFLNEGTSTGVQAANPNGVALNLSEKNRPTGSTANRGGVVDNPPGGGKIIGLNDALDDICAKLKAVKSVAFTGVLQSGPPEDY